MRIHCMQVAHPRAKLEGSGRFRSWSKVQLLEATKHLRRFASRRWEAKVELSHFGAVRRPDVLDSDADISATDLKARVRKVGV